MVVTCSNIGGDTIATIMCRSEDTAADLRSKIAQALDEPSAALEIILPSGEQLRDGARVSLPELFGLV